MDPKDPKVKCAKYDEKYTFKDCSGQKAEETFTQLLGCVPPWFTDDSEKVCEAEDTDRIKASEAAVLGSYIKIMTGNQSFGFVFYFLNFLTS